MNGRIVSHYQILERFGEGDRGVAYKAQNLKLNRLVALKNKYHCLMDEGICSLLYRVVE